MGDLPVLTVLTSSDDLTGRADNLGYAAVICFDDAADAGVIASQWFEAAVIEITVDNVRKHARMLKLPIMIVMPGGSLIGGAERCVKYFNY
jgi:hypothetical protein